MGRAGTITVELLPEQRQAATDGPVLVGCDRRQTQLVESVRAALTPELLKTEWRGKAHPMAGHCYVASEALYHLLGGKAAGLVPQVIQHEGGTHWFLRGPGGQILDPTADQFKTPVPYAEARGAGFLTRNPSKRARVVIGRVS